VATVEAANRMDDGVDSGGTEQRGILDSIDDENSEETTIRTKLKKV